MYPLPAPLLVSNGKPHRLSPLGHAWVRGYPLTHTYAKNGDFAIPTPTCPINRGFLDAYEIFLNRGIERQDSNRSHYDRHQEYKIN
jgi:hypothetical protein